MTKLITANEAREHLKKINWTQENFAEEYRLTDNQAKDVLHGKTKLTKERQLDYLDKIRLLALDVDVICDVKHKVNYKAECDVKCEAKCEKKNNLKIVKGINILAARGEFLNDIYKGFEKWIQTEEVDVLSSYWDNFDRLYTTVDLQATQFLYCCIEITPPTSKLDRRLELLRFMQDFSSSVAAIQKAMPTIKNFLSAGETIKRKQLNFNRTAAYKNKNVSCPNPIPESYVDYVQRYRNKLLKRFEKMFFESKSNQAVLVIHQANFITTMDKTDWELLIAYTLVRADDESGEKLQQIADKLESLLAEENRA